MIHAGQISKILNQVIKKGGCAILNWPGCSEARQKYKKISKAPGCSACAKRRAKNALRASIVKYARNKNFNDIWPPEDQ